MNDENFKGNAYLYEYIPQTALYFGWVGYFFFIPFLMFLVNKGYIEINVESFNRLFLSLATVFIIMFLSFDKNSAFKHQIPNTENYSVAWIQVLACIFIFLRSALIPSAFYLIVLSRYNAPY